MRPPSGKTRPKPAGDPLKIRRILSKQFRPALIDHNTESYGDPNINLYAVFEFIPGPTLGEHIAATGCLALNDALALVTALLITLRVYHDVGSGHRDIKPDNIILRDGNPRSPVLIDFGLTFNVDEGAVDDTPDWQQVGNRFLSLPEHAPFSANKRDLRSDLTFSVGILFFVLTGRHPVTLIDEEQRFPHQRTESRTLLHGIREQERLPLLTVFDVGFSPNLSHRWQSIEALMTQIDRITSRMANEDRDETRITDIRERAAAKSGNMVIREGLDTVRARIRAAAKVAIGELGEGFGPSIEEKLTTMRDMSCWIRCGVDHVYDGGLTNTYFLIKAIGDELVICESSDPREGDGVPVSRIPVEAPASVPDLEEIVRRTIIANVGRDVSGS
jgi:serine/threonine protein kinase